MMGYIVAGIALTVALAVVIYSRWRTGRTIKRLDAMFTAATNGTFLETQFDETKLSALESRVRRYLTASALSARNVQEQKDQISGQMNLEDILTGWEGEPEEDALSGSDVEDFE